MSAAKTKVVALLGGLGNQMFLYASSLVIKNKCVYSILGCGAHNGFELNKIFKLNIKLASFWQNSKVTSLYVTVFGRLVTMRRVEEKLLTKNIFFKRSKKHFDGNWHSIPYTPSLVQKYDYFSQFCLTRRELDGMREELLEKFTFPALTGENLKISNKIHAVNSVSIHVRLGDYLGTNFINLSESNYYQLALKRIQEKVNNPHFFIFSDELNKCQQLFKSLPNCDFIGWNAGQDSFRDMQLMSLCKHNIVANSSFSFWGAYLNNYQHRIIVCPKVHYEYPQNWSVVPFNRST